MKCELCFSVYPEGCHCVCMDLEVKGIAASPRRQTQLSSRGKKCQGWRPDTRAARGPRPPEVPCLDLGRLGDSDDEDGNSYIPCSRSFPHTCSLNSSSDWRTSLETPRGQHLPSQQSLSLLIFSLPGFWGEDFSSNSEILRSYSSQRIPSISALLASGALTEHSFSNIYSSFPSNRLSFCSGTEDNTRKSANPYRQT